MRSVAVVEDGLLRRIKRLTPVLSDLWEVWLSLHYGFGMAWTSEEWQEANVPSIMNINSFLEQLNTEEAKSLNKVQDLVEDTINNLSSHNTEEIKPLIINRLKENKKPALRIKDYVCNFVLKRVIDTVERYPMDGGNCYDDFLWKKVKIGGYPVLVPGFRERGEKILTKEIEFLRLISRTVRMFTMEDAGDGSKQLNYKTIDINKVKKNTAIDEDSDVDSFIQGRIEKFVEASFPGSNKIAGDSIGVSYSAVYTTEVLFVYVRLFEYTKAAIFPFIIKGKAGEVSSLLFILLMRMLKVLEGENWDFSPLDLWVKEEMLQRVLPPDIKDVSQSSNVRVFVSDQTRILIHMLKEGEPYFRITFYPFELFERELSEYDDVDLGLERSVK